LAGIKEELLKAHNNERAKKGVRPLGYNKKLDAAAQKHTEWMAINRNLDHNEGRHSVGDRVTDEDYQWSWVGENIAEGQGDTAEVMDSWMHSSGHRANILNGHYQEVGFGYAKDRNGTIYWTADFASN